MIFILSFIIDSYIFQKSLRCIKTSPFANLVLKIDGFHLILSFKTFNIIIDISANINTILDIYQVI